MGEGGNRFLDGRAMIVPEDSDGGGKGVKNNPGRALTDIRNVRPPRQKYGNAF